jgi:hypothetical protein
MKEWVKFAWVFILIIVAVLCWYEWDSRKNHGLNFGYYGEFNTVSNALSRMTDVHILKSWYNAGLSLEGFGFEIARNERHWDIAFPDGDPIRKMSGADLEKALSEFVAKEAAAQSTN